jgi:hypothetical protein
MSFSAGVLFFRTRDVVKLKTTTSMNSATIAISRRLKTTGPNHHLWNNHGTWWFHSTVHLPDFTKWRLRKNLRTSDVQTARLLRDRILAERGASSSLA